MRVKALPCVIPGFAIELAPITERTREIGLLRAIGMRRRQLRQATVAIRRRTRTTGIQCRMKLLGVPGLIVAKDTGLGAAQLPARGDAAREAEAVTGQGRVDPAAHLGLRLRLGREQHPQPYLVTGALRVG